MSAWYVATETTSETKKGGYVQGTVTLVLRKRRAQEPRGLADQMVVRRRMQREMTRDEFRMLVDAREPPVAKRASLGVREHARINSPRECYRDPH